MSRATLAVALVLGILVDQWFRHPWLGLGLAVLVGLLLAGLGGLAALAGRRPHRHNLWLVPFLLWFAVVPALRDAPFLVWLSLTGLAVVAVLIGEFYAGPALPTVGPLRYFWAAVNVGVVALARPIAPVGGVLADAAGYMPVGRSAAPVVRGLIIATPFLAVFTVLLASADVVFGAYVDRLTRLEIPFDLGPWLGHTLVALAVGWVLAGGLLHTLRAPQLPAGAILAAVAAGPAGPTTGSRVEPTDTTAGEGVGEPAPVTPPDTAAPTGGGWMGFGETATVLAAVDLLFGAFVLVQFAYLFGGRETLDVAGLTYAEYARRGFFELLAVAAIALPLVLGLDWLGRRDTVRQRRLFQALASAMVLLTVAILASAMVRMVLYEEAYGYTQLRVYSHAFMIWLAVLCGLFVAALLAERRQWLVFGTLVSALVGLAALGALDPDRFIAEHNLARYVNGRPLDATHLTDLSADATPVVLRGLDLAVERDDGPVRDALGRGLRRQLAALDEAAAAPWPTWGLARAQAYAALADRRADLDAYPLRQRRTTR